MRAHDERRQQRGDRRDRQPTSADGGQRARSPEIHATAATSPRHDRHRVGKREVEAFRCRDARASRAMRAGAGATGTKATPADAAPAVRARPPAGLAVPRPAVTGLRRIRGASPYKATTVTWSKIIRVWRTARARWLSRAAYLRQLPRTPGGTHVRQSIVTALARQSSGCAAAAKTHRRQHQDALREVRLALLEADVALPVVEDFVAVDQGEGGRRGSHRIADAGTGADRRRPSRADGADGRRGRAARSSPSQPPAVHPRSPDCRARARPPPPASSRSLLRERRRRRCCWCRPTSTARRRSSSSPCWAAQVGADVFPSTTGEKPVAIAQRRARLGAAALSRRADRRHRRAGSRIDEAMMREIARAARGA